MIQPARFLFDILALALMATCCFAWADSAPPRAHSLTPRPPVINAVENGRSLSEFQLNTRPPNEQLPDRSKYQVFRACPPYEIQVHGRKKRLLLGSYGSHIDSERSFDLVSSLIDPRTGRMNAMSWQAAYPYPDGLRFKTIHDNADTPPTNEGIPGRIERKGTRLKIAYLAGDPPLPGKPPRVKTQINSWPVPTGRDLAWDLAFQLGGSSPDEAWPMLPPGKSPALIWQLLPQPGHPTLAIMSDTDDAAAGTIKLSFSLRTSDTVRPDWAVVAGGLKPNAPIDVFMTANLDERESDDGGHGYWRVWVNGKQIVSYDGKTLRADFAKDPHRWTIGLYLFSEKQAVPFSLVTYWQRASMLVPK